MITVKPDSGYVLDDLTVTDKNGNELKLTDKGNGKYTFTRPSGKVEVKATFAKEVETSPFADVTIDAYYYEAVKWAVKNGITDGVGNDLFAPGQPCARAQIVTFLWRAAGSPEPKGTAVGMTDVVSGSYYEKAVAWAIFVYFFISVILSYSVLWTKNNAHIFCERYCCDIDFRYKMRHREE